MICAHCSQDSVPTASGLCLRCGSVLHISGPTRLLPTSSPIISAIGQAQKVIPAATQGPLFTRSPRWDFALGLSGEIAALGLLIYGVFFFAASFAPEVGMDPLNLALAGIGGLATAVLMYRYTKTMRRRYPGFARGWRFTRIGFDCALNFFVGLLASVVIIPVGYLLWGVLSNLGIAGLFVGALIIYLIGMKVRHWIGFGPVWRRP